MSESMIERVARAMFDADASGYHGISVPFEGQASGVQDRWLRLALAAIEAMREPTDAMVDAPLPASPSHGGRYENRCDLRPYIYRAMIDAALNEQVSG